MCVGSNCGFYFPFVHKSSKEDGVQGDDRTANAESSYGYGVRYLSQGHGLREEKEMEMEHDEE